jgi:sulfoacetaldehyde acetyltransferase
MFTEALRTAVKENMEDDVTTFIEVVMKQELGDPFRSDAMKKPVVLAGINKDDLCPRPGA